MTNLDQAKRYFAETYHAGVVGETWESACDFADFMANQFRWKDGNEPASDFAVSEALRGEACRYANM